MKVQIHDFIIDRSATVVHLQVSRGAHSSFVRIVLPTPFDRHWTEETLLVAIAQELTKVQQLEPSINLLVKMRGKMLEIPLSAALDLPEPEPMACE